MDQERLDDLEKKVANIEDGNGWHESAKYVLEKLDTLTDTLKENRVENGTKIDKLIQSNSNDHKALHDKMDVQKTFCASRPLECQRLFLPNRTFHWLLIVLIVLFCASFSLSGTALKQNADHKNKVIEYKMSLDAERKEVNEELDNIHRIISDEEAQE